MLSGWLEPTGIYSEDDVLSAVQRHIKAGALPILDRLNSGIWYSSGFVPYDNDFPESMWYTSDSL